MKVVYIYKQALILVTGSMLTFSVAGAERSAPVTDVNSIKQIEQRLDNIERSLQNQGLIDMLQQLQQLQTEVTNLRGQIELNTYELENLKERQRKLFTDIDSRLQKLEKQQQPAGAETPALTNLEPSPESEQPAGTPTDSELTIDSTVDDETAATPEEDTQSEELSEPVTPPSATDEDPLQAQEQYQQAFNLLKQAEYDDAITAFNTFLSKFPDSTYSENAQYWISEAYYVTRRFDAAITEYMKVIDNYPNSQRVPTSLLKIGYCYLELGKKEDGKKILMGLIEKYPGTDAALDAQKRLDKISS